MKTGTQLIAEERQRQIEKEGWNKEHDNEHIFGELSVAAACYALNKLPEPMRKDLGETNKIEVLESWHKNGPYGDAFPWQKECDKREKHSRLKSLIIAGALIAAEIDRELSENPQEGLKQDKSLFCQRNKTN